MEGTAKDPGLAPRAISRLFDVMAEREKGGHIVHECFMTMIELYNESGARPLAFHTQCRVYVPNLMQYWQCRRNARGAVRDLLANPNDDHSRKKYDIQRHAALGMYVRDLVTPQVNSAEVAQSHVRRGHTNRSVGATNLNEQSSRSHMVLNLTVLATNAHTGEQHVGKLSLCDLAGSERLSKIDTTGVTRYALHVPNSRPIRCAHAL